MLDIFISLLGNLLSLCTTQDSAPLCWAEQKIIDLGLQGELDPNKISGVGAIFGLLVHVLPGQNKQRACKPSLILS
jgi:hypothetical protein